VCVSVWKVTCDARARIQPEGTDPPYLTAYASTARSKWVSDETAPSSSSVSATAA